MGGNGIAEAQPATPVPPPPPAGSPDPLAAAAAGPGERGKLRRHLRKLKRTRERQLAELGTLVIDARKRSNGSRPEVVDRRAAETAEIDRQVRELSHAVDAHGDRRPLVAGVRGSCQSCGTLLATEDRFCPACGTPTKAGRARPADPSAVAPRAAAAVAVPSGPPPPSPTTPYAAVDPSRIPPPPPPPGAQPQAPPIPEPLAPGPADGGYAHVDRSTIPPPPPPPPAS